MSSLLTYRAYPLNPVPGAMIYPATPPVSDLSRQRLKELARWIRDDLDLLVAREGPHILEPDDVLTLHETFLALRYAQHIVASDLRATGIHRAVQDIAGVATRWPGRLCDDCDKLHSIWTARFGPLGDLHPFLYGRGGRLEGLASATEYSRESLLKRWVKTCPERLNPKLSHRLGDIGFRAGTWWVNSLFAHHAGIIGPESIDGGITFDENGAYALVLKETGDVEASSEDQFTYRCRKNDKGKFRLTSASRGSREPIRVLRSHSLNSIWGPKAGIRYEGLFSVKGWSIRTAKTTDIVSRRWRKGDILFDVRIERSDQVPIAEVTLHPTAAEVDDYTEYKRLRRIYREKNHKGPTAPSIKRDLQIAAKAAPPILPVQSLVPPSAASEALRKPSPSTSRKSIFRKPNFDEEPHVPLSPGQDVVSPMTVTDVDQFGLTMNKGTFKAPAQLNRISTHGGTSPPPSDVRSHVSPSRSNDRSMYMTVSAQSDIREVAPWTDYDIGLNLPSPGSQSPVNREEVPSKDIKFVPSSVTPDPQDIVNPFDTQRERRKSDETKGITPTITPTSTGKKDFLKPNFMRSRNPIAKLFDGVDEYADDYFGNAVNTVRAVSVHERPKQPKPPPRRHSSSPNGQRRVSSPTPIRPSITDSPLSPFSRGRRDAICPANDFASLFAVMPIGRIGSTTTLMLPKSELNDPFVEPPPSHMRISLPVTLHNIISPPRAATSILVAEGNNEREGRAGAVAARRLAMMEEANGMEVKVMFRDPFSGGSPPLRSMRERKSSLGVAPDVVG
ncbi:Nn.00g006850.m01.CDS01 [Neocucurbitaria sp. VM-36]